MTKTGATQLSSSTNTTQLISIASDGTSLFWDLRLANSEKVDLAQLDLTWKPFFKVLLSCRPQHFLTLKQVILARVEHSGDYGGLKMSVNAMPHWFARSTSKDGEVGRGNDGVLLRSSSRTRINEEISSKIFVGTEVFS